MSLLKYKYVIDTSSLIQAFRLYYQFSYGMEFWNCIKEHVDDGTVCLFEAVYEEIKEKDDELARWVQKLRIVHKGNLMPQIDNCYSQICEYVENTYDDTKRRSKDKFIESADAWVVSVAKMCDSIIVTQETAMIHTLSYPVKKNVKKNVKIPDVARAFQIVCNDTFEFLNDIGFEFKKY